MVRSTECGIIRRTAHLALFMFVLSLSACGRRETPPTIEQIREAYAAHPDNDTSGGVDLGVVRPRISIPDQSPACISEGDFHFDCKLDLITEANGRRTRERKDVHVWNDAGEWHVDILE